MKFDKERWKGSDVNTDSLWLIGSRAKGGKRENIYHGNFAPQIPDDLIRRYTEEGDVVLEPFTGSGTTLYECERLNRYYIGFDINEEIVSHIRERMGESSDIRYFIHNEDATDPKKTALCIRESLKQIGRQRVDFILSHPPYWDIIKFTEREEDLSAAPDLKVFLEKFATSTCNMLEHLRSGRYFAFVAGDIYRDGEVVPLAFYMMYAIKKRVKCKLKGIVVKDIVGNKGKIGKEGLWRYCALRNGMYLFKHEYIFVFKK